MKPLLVGEDNPYHSDPAYALYPLPTTSAGGRLCSVIMGLRRTEYLRRFDRVNLCDERWRQTDARRRAAEILEQDRPAIVLLGAKVCTVFGVPFEPFTLLDRASRAGPGLPPEPRSHLFVRLPGLLPKAEPKKGNPCGCCDPEKEAFFASTPVGSFEVGVVRPGVLDGLEAGDEVYLEIVKVPK